MYFLGKVWQSLGFQIRKDLTLVLLLCNQGIQVRNSWNFWDGLCMRLVSRINSVIVSLSRNINTRTRLMSFYSFSLEAVLRWIRRWYKKIQIRVIFGAFEDECVVRLAEMWKIDWDKKKATFWRICTLKRGKWYVRAWKLKYLRFVLIMITWNSYQVRYLNLSLE